MVGRAIADPATDAPLSSSISLSSPPHYSLIAQDFVISFGEIYSILMNVLELQSFVRVLKAPLFLEPQQVCAPSQILPDQSQLCSDVPDCLLCHNHVSSCTNHWTT